MSEDNGFLIFCASLAGAFLMLGTMCLQYGLAYAGMAVCLPYLIAVSISVGEGSYPPETEAAQPVLGVVHLPFSLASASLAVGLAHQTAIGMSL